MATIPFRGILKSLAVTLATALRKPVTIQYPNERYQKPERVPGFPALIWDAEHGEPFCTGCQVCARYCPTNAIYVTMTDNPKYETKESPRRKIVEDFYLDLGRCIQCQICVQVCNFDAIEMSPENEFSVWDKRTLVFDLRQLLHFKEQTNPHTRHIARRSVESAQTR